MKKLFVALLLAGVIAAGELRRRQAKPGAAAEDQGGRHGA